MHQMIVFHNDFWLLTSWICFISLLLSRSLLCCRHVAGSFFIAHTKKHVWNNRNLPRNRINQQSTKTEYITGSAWRKFRYFRQKKFNNCANIGIEGSKTIRKKRECVAEVQLEKHVAFFSFTLCCLRKIWNKSNCYCLLPKIEKCEYFATENNYKVTLFSITQLFQTPNRSSIAAGE